MQSANAQPGPLSFGSQRSNTLAKGDRLAAPAPNFQLASLESTPATLTAQPPMAFAPSAAPAPHKPAAVAMLPPPPELKPQDKPKRSAATISNGLFEETQIPGFKGRLRLTHAQEEYWPAVEAALRGVIRHQTREARRRGARAGAPPIDVNSAEVQQLISAAMPLLMTLREDQKREVRQLARVIGLESVASAI